MISKDEIRKYFPGELTGAVFYQHMVKEYLQAMVLSKLFKSKNAAELVFIGGPSLRFCYGLDRFSEDLDFDFFGKDKESLRELFSEIARSIKKEGIKCELEHNYKDTDNFCKLIFPDAARAFKLSDPRKKLWIKIDIQQNRTKYTCRTQIINRFGLYFPVSVPEKNVLFSMKAVVLTQRVKARDMYDFSFLCSDSLLDMDFIRSEFRYFGKNVRNPNELKDLILEAGKNIDIKEKVHEISLFLQNKENSERVRTFYDYIRQLDIDKLTIQTDD